MMSSLDSSSIMPTFIHMYLKFLYFFCCSQSCLFECLQKTKLITDSRSCHYTRCGRTDKGVSAFGQVCINTQRTIDTDL